MLVSDILRRVQKSVGDSSGAIVDSATIYDLINDAQLAINAEAEILRAIVGINTVAGTRSYAVPVDFISCYSMELNPSTTTAVMLPYVSRGDIYSKFPEFKRTADRGTPVGYFFDGGLINFFPVPDVAGTAQLDYVRIPTAVNAVGQTPELPAYIHPLIVRMCVALIKETDEDYEASQLIKNEVFTELGLLKSRTQQTDNAYAVIRDDDPWALTYE